MSREKQNKIDYSVFFNTSLDLLAVASKEGVLLEVNDIWEDVTGHSQSYFINKELKDFIVTEDHVPLVEMFSRLILGEPVSNFENRLIKKDGKAIWLSWTAKMVEDKIFMIAHETSEMKRVQKMLEDTQSLAKVGGWNFELQRRKLNWATHTYQIFNLPQGVPVSMEDLSNFILDGYREEFTRLFDRAVDEGTSFSTEIRIRTFDNQEKWLEVKASYEESAQGKKRLIGLFRDITLEKETSQQVNEYRERLGVALVATGVGIWEWDLVTNELIWDDIMFDLYEMKKEDFDNTYEAWSSSLDEEQLAIAEEVLNESIESKTNFRHEFRIKSGKGKEKFIKAEAKVFSDSDGKPIKMIGANWDVSEERFLEGKLRESEERYELAVYGSSVGIWDWNLRDDRMYWSRLFCEICGINEAMVPTHELFMDLLHPDDLKALDRAFKEHIFSHKVLDLQCRLIHQETMDTVWVRLKGQAVWNIEGKALRIAGSIEDITASKKASDSYHKSLLQFQALTETAPVGIILIENNRHVSYVNDMAFEILGKEKMESPDWQYLVEYVNTPEGQPKLESLLSSGNADVEISVSSGGESRYGYAYTKAMVDSSGHEYGKLLVLTDITKLIKIEKELEEKQSTIHTILNNTIDAIVTFDKSGNVYNANIAVEKIFGHTLANFKDLNFFTHLMLDEGAIPVGEDEARSIDEFQDLDNELAYEMIAVRQSGRNFPIEISLGSLEIEGEDYYTAVIRDIETRKKTEAELKRAVEESKQANKTKSLFLANMSHEIRTPLNSILGMADLLTETPLDDEQTRYVRNFKESGDSLLAIINDILDISKVESGQMTLETIPFDLENVLDQVMDLHSVSAYEKGIEVFYDFKTRLDCQVLGDPYRLKQIVLNLLGNAVKFTREGTVALLIDIVSTEKEFVEIEFAVRDTGVGIPDDKIQHVFESFTQADSSTTRLFGGTGLGLNITKTLIEMMGGELKVESKEGKGSTFSFRIPMLLSDNKVLSTPSLDLKDTRVLVLVENPYYQSYFNRSLEEMGAIVDIYDEVSEAYMKFNNAKAENKPYSIVIIDHMLGGVAGYDVIRRFNKNKDLNDQFLYLMNANSNNADILRLKDLGIKNYLNKPMKFREWRTMLKNIMNPDVTGTLLVVDDDVDILDIVRFKMERTNMKLIQTADPKEALDILEKGKVDAVFADYIMKGMNGLEFAKNIRMKNKEIPIVIGSSSSPTDFDGKTEGLNISAIFEKPYDYKVLTKVLQDKVREGMKQRSDTPKKEEVVHNLSGMKILLVDDSEKNRNLVKFYLAKSDVELKEAENGEEAFKLYSNNDFDVVLMDMQMPIMDGYTATKKIREWEQFNKSNETPVIALTAFALKGEKEKSIDAGCNEHLAKPIKKAKLIESLAVYGKKAA